MDSGGIFNSMSAIILKNLETPRATKLPSESLLYSDIALDFKINTNTKDLTPAFDDAAVRNSVFNILNTRPGENFLFPDFGLAADKYLFEPVSEFNGQLLGDEVVRAITKYEPRVTVQSVRVGVNIDLQQYTVTIVLLIPTISKQITFNPIFTRDGLYFTGS